MRETSGHPAVLAGLMGIAEWGVPTVAVALPLEDATEVLAHSVLLQFVVGCAAGAVVAGLISVVADRLSRDRTDVPVLAKAHGPSAGSDEPQAADDERWSTSSLNLMHLHEQEAEEDPTGDLGRIRTGRITIDAPAQEPHKRGRRFAEGPASTSRRPAPRHAAHVAPVTPAQTQGRHFATHAAPAPSVSRHLADDVQVAAAQPVRGRHFAASVAARRTDVEQLVAAEEQRRTSPAPKAEASAATRPSKADIRARLASLPTIEPRAGVAPVVPRPVSAPEPAKAPVEAAPSAAATSAAPASDVTNRLGLRERVALRTKDVRQVLAERLSPDAMSSIPVITRADGSVGDVAPATWLDQTLAPMLASLSGAFEKIDDTARREAVTPHDPVAQAEPAPAASRPVMGESRSAYIAGRVAEVDLGMFPARRSADELEHRDVWEQALAAMGETIREETSVFEDVVGGPSTIDDPDDLEGPTGFIPFRVPAGRPEVVDTETYIDYLLRDEFSQNESQVIRRSSRSYLRVIEGGSSAMRAQQKAEDTNPKRPRTGRHFASSRMAMEA